MIEALELIGSLTLHLALTAAPGVAAGLVMLRLGARSITLVLVGALCASGTVALLAFWGYYGDPVLGKAWAVLVPIISVGLGAWAWRGLEARRSLLAPLLAPLALWAMASVFVVFLGFLHEGGDNAVQTAGNRFSHQLPSDNDIPRFYASWFAANGHSAEPPTFGEAAWRSSDRPPLQLGYLLSQRPLVYEPDGIGYQVHSVALQQLWVIAVWALFCAAGIGRRARALAMISLLAGDVAIVHGFFVWPKLLSAAFLLAALALAIAPEWARWRRDPALGALFGALCALAMLAHGAAVFALAPLLVVAVWRGRPTLGWATVAILAAFALTVPWSAYQRWGDPPGDRLVKWQIAGVTEVDPRGVPEAIVDSYRDLGLGGVAEAKWENLVELSGLRYAGRRFEATRDAVRDSDLEAVVEEVRATRFFSLLPLIGFFLLAPLAMLLAPDRGRRRPAEWRFALVSFAFVAIGCVAWIMLLFGPPNAVTMVHAGSLALPLLAVCGCVAGLYAVSPRLAYWLVGVNAALVLAIYTPAFLYGEGTTYSPFAALLAVCGLVGFSLLAWRTPSGEAAPDRPASAGSHPVAGDLHAEPRR